MKPHEPTEAEIREACRQIQQEWNRHERRQRAAWLEDEWQVPEVRKPETR